MNGKNMQASAPGKLILLGEYAVLEQSPCLVSAVQRECTVNIAPQDEPWFRIKSSRSKVPNVECQLTPEGEFRFRNGLSDEGYKQLRFVLSTLKHVVQQFDQTARGADIFINTDPFFHQHSEQKLGLGASAAITVSLLAALAKFANEKLTEQELYRQAFKIHREAQGGLGSGMDIAASATGGVIEYKMPPANSVDGIINPVEWPESLRMIPVWTGYSASTQNMVQQVKAFRDADLTRYEAIMQPMQELSEDGCDAFKGNNAEAFLEIVAEYASQEQKLGKASGADIISEVHQNIGATIRRAGGSYKPSGAGGGDIGVAFTSNGEAYHNVKQAIGKSSFDMLDLPLQTGQFADQV